MQLTKASATALDTAQKCLARYVASTRLVRGAEGKNHAALVGSVCHRALELYVTSVIMESKYVRDIKTMEIFCMQAYIEIYDDNLDSDAYKECLKICRNWYNRMTFEGFQVVSCEVKENFLIKGLSSGVDVPFNFIMDRLDEIKPDLEYRVVDYKSFQIPLSPEELHDKLQARAYALATQIKFPTATRIWVAFDLLRHDKVVQSAFTREDNIATWKEIKQTCERIIALDEENAPETVNETCGFCIKAATCKAKNANAKAGGIFAFEDINQLIDARKDLFNQRKAVAKALQDMDDQIMALLKQNQARELVTENTKLIIKSRQLRQVDEDVIAELVPAAVWKRYSKTSITIGDFEQLLEDPDIVCDSDLVEALKAQIKYVPSRPYIETKDKK